MWNGERATGMGSGGPRGRPHSSFAFPVLRSTFCRRLRYRREAEPSTFGARQETRGACARDDHLVLVPERDQVGLLEHALLESRVRGAARGAVQRRVAL